MAENKQTNNNNQKMVFITRVFRCTAKRHHKNGHVFKEKRACILHFVA